MVALSHVIDFSIDFLRCCLYTLDREYYESLSLEEKRKHYKYRNDYVTLEEIETWPATRNRLGE